MDDSSSQAITGLLLAWRDGSDEALAALTPLVYEELRRLARAQMRGERAGHTLVPTALVHEAFVRLVDARVDWRDRTHFLSVAAVAMRRVLVDHARRRIAEKRGGRQVRVTLTSEPSADDALPEVEMIALHEALERLASLDARQARIVELHYFGGLSYPEIVEVVGASQATVERDMRHARAWLRRQLSGD